MRADYILLKRRKIYDDLSSVLYDYEEGRANGEDLYDCLVNIQNNWETVITSEC